MENHLAFKRFKIMSDDDKALLRLSTMSDWIEFPSFKKDKLLDELKPFEKDWKRYNYNTKKPNNRWGLSVTSIDGGLHGIPDLSSLRDWQTQTGQVIHNHDSIIKIAGEYYKNVKTNEWISEDEYYESLCLKFEEDQSNKYY